MTPALDATSSIEVAWKPRSAKALAPASRRVSRRERRFSRTRVSWPACRSGSCGAWTVSDFDICKQYCILKCEAWIPDLIQTGGRPDGDMATLDFTEDELLESERCGRAPVVSGTLCHGGIRSDGSYLSPRTAVRTPAIAAWQEHHRAVFGTELLDAPIEAWPPAYPNVAQARHLIANGVRDPIISILTRIGTVEGFGAGLRYLAPGQLAPADIQACFEEDVRSTATWHLGRGLIEAHARDEAGWGPEAGHDRMWFAVRDSGVRTSRHRGPDRR